MTAAFTPYSGSLLKLAFTTIGIIALFAAALMSWEHSITERARPHSREGKPAALTIVPAPSLMQVMARAVAR